MPPSALDRFNGVQPKASALDRFNGTAEPVDEPSVGGFVRNIGSSAFELGKNVVGAVAGVFTPNLEENTVANLGRVGLGVAEKVIPGQQGHEKYADAVGRYYKQRYGSNLAQTLYEDPVGVVADVAGLATGIGGAAKLAGASKIAATATKAGSILDPVQAIGRAGGAAKPLLRKGAERIISSNVKVPDSMKAQNPTKNIPANILDAGFSPSHKGADQANMIVESLGNDISNLVASSKQAGQQFNLQPVLDKLDELEEVYKHQPAAETDLAAVRNAREQLMNNPLYSEDILVPQVSQVPSGVLDQFGKPVMKSQTTMVKQGRRLKPQTAVEIDTMKKNVYAGLKGKYGVEKAGTIEADKAMGRGLKGILDDNVPGVQALNAKQSDAIVSRNALAKMAGREENKYPLGLMDLAAGGAAAGGIASGNPAIAAAAILATLLKHPTTAFPIARGLNRVSKGQTPEALRAVGRGLTPVAQVNEAQHEGQLRPVTAQEVEEKYAGYLAALQ